MPSWALCGVRLCLCYAYGLTTLAEAVVLPSLPPGTSQGTLLVSKGSDRPLWGRWCPQTRILFLGRQFQAAPVAPLLLWCFGPAFFSRGPTGPPCPAWLLLGCLVKPCGRWCLAFACSSPSASAPASLNTVRNANLTLISDPAEPLSPSHKSPPPVRAAKVVLLQQVGQQIADAIAQWTQQFVPRAGMIWHLLGIWARVDVQKRKKTLCHVTQ